MNKRNRRAPKFDSCSTPDGLHNMANLKLSLNTKTFSQFSVVHENDSYIRNIKIPCLKFAIF